MDKLYGNKLIVDFMEIKPKSVIANIYYYQDAPFFYVSETTSEKVMDAIVDYVKYSTSWDWLKPVINKLIKTIGVKSENECTEEEWFYYTSIVRMYIGVNIETAYKYVVEFLEWYNQK